MTKELLTGSVWPEIHAAARRRGRKYAAVAFIGADGAALLSEFGEGDILVCNAGSAALRTGSTFPDALAALLRRGVQVYTHDRLHAKVYVFGGCAFIGSANASATSVGRLEEAAMRISDKEVVAEARRFVLRMRNDSIPVDDHYLELARHQFRRPRGGAPKRGPTTGTVQPSVCLIVTDYQREDAPPAVDAHWRKHFDQWRSCAGAETKWSLNILWNSEPRWIRRDDWVITVCTNVDPCTVDPPMKVLGITPVGGNSKQFVTWLRAPVRKKPLLWERFCGQILVASHSRLRIDKRVTSAAAVDAVFAAWRLSPED